MLSVVLLFGLMDIIFGSNTSTLQSSSVINTSVVVHQNFANVTTAFPPTITNATTDGISRSIPSTTQSPSSREQSTFQESISPTLTSFSISTFSGKLISTSLAIQATTPTTTASGKPAEDPINKEKVLWWDVKTGALKNMFYGASVLATVCIISLIVVCCCWRRQTRTVKKLQRQHTTLSNPYVNSRVVGFPSPLQLDSFVIRPESTYDTPEPVETIPQDVDVSYVSVIDGNESESHYAAVRENGTVNVEDSESRDNDPLPSPAYTNASVFEMDPYQELMLANRSNEDHYTSLINGDETEQNEDEVTI